MPYNDWGTNGVLIKSIVYNYQNYWIICKAGAFFGLWSIQEVTNIYIYITLTIYIWVGQLCTHNELA